MVEVYTLTVSFSVQKMFLLKVTRSNYWWYTIAHSQESKYLGNLCLKFGFNHNDVTINPAINRQEPERATDVLVMYELISKDRF